MARRSPARGKGDGVMSGKSAWVAGIAAVLVLGGAGTVLAAHGKCDVATVEKASYCEKCKHVLDKDKLNDKGECKHCKVAAKEIDVCVKKSYECAHCKVVSTEPGKCEKCQKDLTEEISKCPVVYRCPKCKYTAAEAGKCAANCCKDKDVELEKSCEKSGKAPHVAKK